MMRNFSLPPLPPDIQNKSYERLLSFLDKKKKVIEIGSGRGDFSISYAEKNPDKHIISFERTNNKFKKFLNLLETKKNLENLLAIQGDAIWWISHFIKPESIEEYFILYPNPYPKNRNKNLRWAHSTFTNYMIKTLKNKGRITLATDQVFYKDEMIEAFQKNLKLIENKTIDLKTTHPRTQFEKKYLEQKRNCYNLVFEKNFS